MAFNWNFSRQPDLTNYMGAQIDPYNASRIASENMQGYKPNAAFAPGTPAEQAAAAMQGYTPNPQGGQFSVPNDMHGGNAQPDLEGYGESLQAASDAAAQAQAIEEQKAELQSQIAALENRIKENTAKLKGWSGNANQIAAIEARKINSQDPTMVWRWKVGQDEARRLAKEQKGESNNTAKVNAAYEIQNDLDSIIVDDKMDSTTQKTYLSKLANLKTLAQKNGLKTDSIDAKIREVKGETNSAGSNNNKVSKYSGKPTEQYDSEIDELLANPTMERIAKWKRDNPDWQKYASNQKIKTLEAKHTELKDINNKKIETRKFEQFIKDQGYPHGSSGMNPLVLESMKRRWNEVKNNGY